MAETTVRIEGLKELQALLRQAGGRAETVLIGTLDECGDEVIAKAVPVTPKRTGVLRNSVKNYRTKREGTGLILTMGAGGAGIPYARRIHELPKQSNWTEPGTGPKYLERPAKEYPWGSSLGSKLRGRLERAIARGH